MGLMEGISSDIDIKAELDAIVSRIGTLEDKVAELTRRIERIDRLQREKQEILKTVRKELKNLFPAGS